MATTPQRATPRFSKMKKPRRQGLYDASGFPNEIWLQVFAEATYVPGALTCSDFHAIASYSKDTHGISFLSSYWESMSVKVALSLVSKRWNALIAEFLFQHLLVQDASSIAQLLYAFNKISTRLGLGYPGHWTLRLDLAMEGIHTWNRHHCFALTAILKKCPRLAIFSTAFCTSAPCLWRPGFQQSIHAGLKGLPIRRLEINYDHGLFNMQLAELASSLEVLWILPPTQCAVAQEAPTAFPKLRILIVSDSDHTVHSWRPFARQWKLPSLKALVIPSVLSCERFIGRRRGDLHQFLNIHGKRLTHLGTPELFFQHGILVQRICSKLAHWSIPASEIIRGFRDSVPFPSLCCIIVENIDNIASTLACISSQVLKDPRLCKALRIIRLALKLDAISRSPDDRQAEKTALKDFFKLCRMRQIRVEVSLGAAQQAANCWRPLF